MESNEKAARAQRRRLRREERKKAKAEKKKLSLRRTLSNDLFALRCIWEGSPLYLIVYLGSSLVYGLLDFLSGSFLLRQIVNGVERGEDSAALIRYVIILGAVSVLSYMALRYFWNVGSAKPWNNIVRNVERKLYRKAAAVELACYESPAFYDKYVRAVEESHNRMMGVVYTLDNLIARIIALTADSFLLFLIDPWLILFGLFPLLLGLLRRRERVLQKALNDERKTLNRRADYVRRTFYQSEYAKEMRMGSMFENMLRDLRETHAGLKAAMRKYGWKIAVLGYLQSIGLEVFTVLGATLYAVWSTLVLGPENGGMMVGDCIVVLGSVSTISWCLSQLIQNIAEFGEHALYLEDIRYFLDYTPTVRDGADIAPDDGGDIVFDNVHFRYEGSETDTIKGVSFTLHRGERIALVGANGSGKTTLVKLLLRLYDPNEGTIRLDGQDIRNFTVRSWRDRFSTVFQDFKIFSMTVRDNVLLRRRRSGDTALVEAALRESDMADKVASYEKGMETVLTREFDDNGENLSVGQQQKLSLSRVFAENAAVVVLDEPSSALDPIAEYQMFENMMRATKGRSVLFISHRLSSAVLADRVLLMEDGALVECGSHAELMALDGKYAAMFRRQAENYLGEEATHHA